MKPAVFLDRDGVINRKPPNGSYITSVFDFEFLPDVTECVKRLNQAGLPVIVVTNQRGVATGSIACLNQIHAEMLRQFAEAGAIISAVYVCPHAHSDGCDCRKPLPGMLLRAASEHKLDLANSWMIGDSSSDIQAGKIAGCKTIKISNCTLSDNEIRPDYQFSDLRQAIQQILQKHKIRDDSCFTSDCLRYEPASF